MREPLDIVQHEHGAIARGKREDRRFHVHPFGRRFAANGIRFRVEHKPALLANGVDRDVRGNAAEPGAELVLTRPSVELRHGAKPRFLDDVFGLVRIPADDSPRRLEGARRMSVVKQRERGFRTLVSNGGYQRFIWRRCVDRVDHPYVQSNGRHEGFAAVKRVAFA